MLTSCDHLNLLNNADIHTMLAKYGEEKEFVHYSRSVTKINHKGKKQARTLLITNRAVYNLFPKIWSKCRRRIPINKIVKVTVSNSTDEFVLHVPSEYDYYFMSEDKNNVVKVIKRVRRKIVGDPPEVVFSDQENLDHIVHKKTDSPVLLPQSNKTHKKSKKRAIQRPSNKRSGSESPRDRLTLRNDDSSQYSISISRQASLDHLDLLNNADVNTMLEENGYDQEVIRYSGKVTKINHRGKQQVRTLMITDRAVYNLNPKTYYKHNRRIPLRNIVQVTVSDSTDEFVLHIPTEYDYWLKSEDKDNVLKVIRSARRKHIGEPPVVQVSKEANLTDIVFKKTEKKEDLPADRMQKLVLEPYKSHQTKSGRLIQIPSKKSHHKHSFRNDSSDSSIASCDISVSYEFLYSDNKSNLVETNRPKLANEGSRGKSKVIEINRPILGDEGSRGSTTYVL